MVNCEVEDILSEYKSPLIVGPCPPPLGGVSVHIDRLSKLVPAAKVFDTSVGGVVKYLRLLMTLLCDDVDVVHLHVLTLKVFSIVFFAKIFRGFSVVTTDHNSRLFAESGYLKNIILRYFLGKVTTKFVVGKQIKATYLAKKIVGASNTVVCNSFIVPPAQEEANILATYPQEFNEFISQHSPVLTTSAYQVVFLDGVDLYGLDMCIDLLHRLKTPYQNAGLIIFLADDEKHSDYLISLKDKIDSCSLQDDVIFISGQRELWPVYRQVDLMLRPTYSDGFGVSVAEAIHLGCPAIASDVCERAEGTQLFKNRDQEGFFRQARLILSRKFSEDLDIKNA